MPSDGIQYSTLRPLAWLFALVLYQLPRTHFQTLLLPLELVSIRSGKTNELTSIILLDSCEEIPSPSAASHRVRSRGSGVAQLHCGDDRSSWYATR
jgi:hypothetical protein